MELICERRGQLEIGAIDHHGHVFAAFGSSVSGRHVTAYTRKRQGRICLTRWMFPEVPPLRQISRRLRL